MKRLKMHVQSCAYQFGQPLVQDSEGTIHSAENNDTSYENQGFCEWRKTKQNKKFEKKKFKMAD